MNDERVRTETITVGDGSFDGLLALPQAASGPGILLLQEIFGVNDFMREKSADLAALGYVVLTPDVFWRIEPGVSLPHDEASLERAFSYMGRYGSEVDDGTKIADLRAALAHLRGLPEVSGHSVAVMGYCLGGFLAYMVAATDLPDACVSYYGSGIAEHGLSLASELTCPVLFHFGGSDPYIPLSDVEKIMSAFADRDDVSVQIEPEAGHAFENLLAPQFGMPEPAGRSWETTVRWLGEHLA